MEHFFTTKLNTKVPHFFGRNVLLFVANNAIITDTTVGHSIILQMSRPLRTEYAFSTQLQFCVLFCEYIFAQFVKMAIDNYLFFASNKIYIKNWFNSQINVMQFFFKYRGKYLERIQRTAPSRIYYLAIC